MKRHKEIENDPLIEQLCEDLNNSRDVRDLALFCSLYIDYFLNELIIKTHNKKPEKIIDSETLGGYFNKTEILNSMGVINNLVVKNIKTIGEIRNHFAHNILLDKELPEKIKNKICSLDFLNLKGEIEKYDYAWDEHTEPLNAQLHVCGAQIVTILQQICFAITINIKMDTTTYPA